MSARIAKDALNAYTVYELTSYLQQRLDYKQALSGKQKSDLIQLVKEEFVRKGKTHVSA